MRRASVATLLCALVVSSGQAALGPMAFPALVSQAEVIVRGRVESVLPRGQSQEGSPARTREVEYASWYVAVLSVDEVLKGPADLRRIRVEFNSMEDSARYEPGEAVFSFLAKTGRDDFYTTVGMLQGRYVIRGGMVGRDRIPVAEFVRRIRDLLRAPDQSGR